MTWPNSVPNLAASPNLYTTSPILWSKAPASLCQVLATSAACLAYFDVTAPLILLVDASDYGLGAALLQPIILHNSSALDKSSLRPTAYSRRPNHYRAALCATRKRAPGYCRSLQKNSGNGFWENPTQSPYRPPTTSANLQEGPRSSPKQL